VFKLVSGSSSAETVGVSREDVGERGRDELVSVCHVHLTQVVTERQIGPCELNGIRRQVRHTAI